MGGKIRSKEYGLNYSTLQVQILEDRRSKINVFCLNMARNRIPDRISKNTVFWRRSKSNVFWWNKGPNCFSDRLSRKSLYFDRISAKITLDTNLGLIMICYRWSHRGPVVYLSISTGGTFDVHRWDQNFFTKAADATSVVHRWNSVGSSVITGGLRLVSQPGIVNGLFFQQYIPQVWKGAAHLKLEFPLNYFVSLQSLSDFIIYASVNVLIFPGLSLLRFPCAVFSVSQFLSLRVSRAIGLYSPTTIWAHELKHSLTLLRTEQVLH